VGTKAGSLATSTALANAFTSIGSICTVIQGEM
jgi:hypothetical protein